MSSMGPVSSRIQFILFSDISNFRHTKKDHSIMCGLVYCGYDRQIITDLSDGDFSV